MRIRVDTRLLTDEDADFFIRELLNLGNEVSLFEGTIPTPLIYIGDYSVKDWESTLKHVNNLIAAGG